MEAAEGAFFVCGLISVISVISAISGVILVQYGRQECAGWFVVQASTHQSHWLRDSQTFAKAPAKQLAVARWKKQSRSGKFLCRANERFYIFVCLAHGVTEKPNDGGVAGDSSIVLHNGCGASRDRVLQFSAAIVAVHFSAHAIAILKVGFGRCPDDMTFDRNSERLALHARQMFAHFIAEFGIQGERARVKAGLNKP